MNNKSTIFIVLFGSISLYLAYSVYTGLQLDSASTNNMENETQHIQSQSPQVNDFPKIPKSALKETKSPLAEQMESIKSPPPPDEVYEQQKLLQMENSFIPSTEPEIPAIPIEMLEAEQAYNKLNGVTIVISGVDSLILPEEHTDIGINIESIEASEPALNQEILRAEEEYTNSLIPDNSKSNKAFDGPLLDPETGSIKQEDYNIEINDLPAIAPEIPVVIL